MRPPAEVDESLAEGGRDTVDALAWFAVVQAPAEARSVCVLLCGVDRGVETLIPLFDAQCDAVQVFHFHDAERAALMATYTSAWRYSRLDNAAVFAEAVAAADLIVIEQPHAHAATFIREHLEELLRDTHGQVLVGIDEDVLNLFGCAYRDSAAMSEAFARLIGPSQCRDVYFRYRCPTAAYWGRLERLRRAFSGARAP